MPALTPEEWAALRGEWEVGATSNIALATRYNVSEKAIRKRAIAETWKRAPEALAAAQAASVTRAVLEHDDHRRRSPKGGRAGPSRAAEPPSPPPEPRKSVGSDHSDPPTDCKEIIPAGSISAEIREITIDRIAEIMAQGTRADLERIDKQAEVFDELHEHIMALLGRRGRASDDEPDRMEELLAAIEGSKDTLAAKISAMTRLSESIQLQRRRAVGLEDKAKRVELTGADGGPIQQVSRVEHELVADFSKLSTDQLEAFFDLARVLEGNTERPPVPAPPGDPVQDAGAADAPPE